MSEHYDIVQVASLGPAFDERLARRYRVLPVWRDPEGLEGYGPDLTRHVRLAVTSVRRGFTRQMLERLPGLQAICSWGVGYDTLDLEAARESGVQASNTPGVLDACVADLAWALLLATARRVAAGDRYVKSAQWRALGEFPLSIKVSGKRLGILGLGRIGHAIARRAMGFDMEVRYHSRHPRADAGYTYEPQLQALAQWADFLIVACVGGPTTYRIVDANVIRALGPRGILVNISRGSVVDQAALVAALRAGELGGAGLDVLESEPSTAEEFKAMDQVVLMPHVGSATDETREAMSQLVMDNVDAWLAGKGLLTPIPIAGQG
ncbi:2-hydroxyacid dehydrogenase [Bordetella sp. 02P26C-1]|uniref:2-hydroxyacid dehydrogenase n=1 Tax=Bordetella sp. 02P26C-1 TaxID=2683195 RepID=UPI0013555F27|nr:2-hydroxyacid dehydrogenase [Bordetella sp. 02P26C-1]MVW77659.1 2-hydroxyacid dehydrogenase [Bordetella sp. 02P26C-1]